MGSLKALRAGEEMNENAKKWVAALRSGDYEQETIGLMRQAYQPGYGSKTKNGPDKFCCLGVLCDISGLAKWKGIGESATPTYMGDLFHLPKAVMEWAGLRDDCGAFGEERALSGINDAGIGFSEIADIIESEPEGLFK